MKKIHKIALMIFAFIFVAAIPLLEMQDVLARGKGGKRSGGGRSVSRSGGARKGAGRSYSRSGGSRSRSRSPSRSYSSKSRSSVFFAVFNELRKEGVNFLWISSNCKIFTPFYYQTMQLSKPHTCSNGRSSLIVFRCLFVCFS